MPELTYQDTGYAGTNVVHTAAAITSVSESFNKANGALGPDLSWTRAVFTHGFPFQVNANQCRIAASTEGVYEDIWVPTPNVSTPTLTFTADVTAFSRTGTGDFVADAGAISRFQTLDNGTAYRGYAFAFGRSDLFVPPLDLWHLGLFRIDHGPGIHQHLLAMTFLNPAEVTLPGVITFVAEGPRMTLTFTHGGSGPTMSVTATDGTYTDGPVVLGGSVIVNGTDTASIDIDNWAVVGDDANLPPDARGFLWVRNTDVSSKTVTVTVPGVTVGIAHPDTAVTVPAGEERMIGPVVPELAIVAGGRPLVAVNYSPNVTGVSAAAVRVP